MIIDKIKSWVSKDDSVVECTTNKHGVYKWGDIDVSNKSLPSWWKDIPNTFNDSNHFGFKKPASRSVFSNFKPLLPTIKYCPAIQGIFSSGLIIKAWSDIKIFVSPEGYVDSIQALDDFIMDKDGTQHPYSQRAGFLPNHAHWKIHSPWALSTKKYRKFFFSGAYLWNPSLIENNIFIIPGHIDFYTQHGTEINMFLPIKNEPYEINFKLGDPLVHLFPLDGKPVKVNKKLIEEKEFRTLDNFHPKFINSAGLLKNKR